MNFVAFKYIVHYPYVLFIRRLFALLKEQRDFLAFLKIIVDITITPFWLILEGEQLWLVHLNLTLTEAEIFSIACNN